VPELALEHRLPNSLMVFSSYYLAFQGGPSSLMDQSSCPSSALVLERKSYAAREGGVHIEFKEERNTKQLLIVVHLKVIRKITE
jgi:hypothetical protein